MISFNIPMEAGAAEGFGNIGFEVQVQTSDHTPDYEVIFPKTDLIYKMGIMEVVPSVVEIKDGACKGPNHFPGMHSPLIVLGFLVFPCGIVSSELLFG